MKLWTVMDENQYNKLTKDGVYTADPAQVMYPKAYDWLVKQMNSKIKNQDNISYPVWAWYKASKNYKPDLRRSMYSAPGTVCYLLEIEIPDDEVVLSDFDYWHYVLNNWPLVDDPDSWPANKNPEETWGNIFNLDWTIDGEPREFFDLGQLIQATFWKLELSQVKSSRKFICR